MIYFGGLIIDRAGKILGIAAALTWIVITWTISFPTRFGIVDLFIRIFGAIIVGAAVYFAFIGLGILYDNVTDEIASWPQGRQHGMRFIIGLAWLIGLAAAVAVFAFTWSIDLGQPEFDYVAEAQRYIGIVFFLYLLT